MRILGVDTTTRFLCLAAYDNGWVYEYNLELGRKHSQLITLSIKRVLEALNWKPEDIDYFACGLGPGSFTGLRIGIATVKGLAWSLNKPVLGIPTLDILAKNAVQDGVIVPAVDAKRGLIYCALYRAAKGGLKKISPYMLLSLGAFLKKIRPGSIILGDAVGLYKQQILRGIKGANILDKDYWYPAGRNIVYLALRQIEQGKISNAFKIKPIYLYPKECQIKKE